MPELSLAAEDKRRIILALARAASNLYMAAQSNADPAAQQTMIDEVHELHALAKNRRSLPTRLAFRARWWHCAAVRTEGGPDAVRCNA